MYVYSTKLPAPSSGDHFGLQANCFLFSCRDSAVFIFPTILADFKDPIQNRDRVPALSNKITYRQAFNLILYALHFGTLICVFVIVLDCNSLLFEKYNHKHKHQEIRDRQLIFMRF